MEICYQKTYIEAGRGTKMITMSLVSDEGKISHSLFFLTDGSVFFWSQCYYNHQHSKSVASDLTFQPL